MERGERRILLGAVIGAFCGLGILLLLGSHAGRSPRPSAFLGPPIPSRQPGLLAGVLVVLDPGHGGEDPGAVCGALTEAALTYRTATEVAACLRMQGAEIVYTVRSRQLDPGLALIEPPLIPPVDAVLVSSGKPLRLRRSPVPLWQRAETGRRVWAQRAKDPKARWNVFFVSLHYDQYHRSGVSGSIVCVDRRTPHAPALSAALAGQIAEGHFGRDSDYRGIKGVSGHELGVLNPAYNPIPEKVLLEIATLSNPQDALQAADSTWRGDMARRITEAIIWVHQQKDTAPGPAEKR